MNVVITLPGVSDAHLAVTGVGDVPASAGPTAGAGGALDIAGEVFDVHVVAGGAVADFLQATGDFFQLPFEVGAVR